MYLLLSECSRYLRTAAWSALLEGPHAQPMYGREYTVRTLSVQVRWPLAKYVRNVRT